MDIMKRSYLIILSIFLITPELISQKMEVPVEIQVPIFFKILTFDRNLEKRSGKKLTIGIVHQSGYKEFLNAKNKFIETLNKTSIKKLKDIPVSLVPIDVDNSDLEDFVSKNEVSALYIAPLRAYNTEDIIKVIQNKKIVTMTGVIEQINSGVSIGIGSKGDKPLIIINLRSAKLEGVDFSSQLLKLAKIIGE